MEDTLENTSCINTIALGKLLADIGEARQPIKILVSNAALFQQTLLSCRLQSLKSVALPKHIISASMQLSPEQNILVCDRKNYEALYSLLLHSPHRAIVLLLQESWTPDWCWAHKEHTFLTRQDLF